MRKKKHSTSSSEKSSSGRRVAAYAGRSFSRALAFFLAILVFLLAALLGMTGGLLAISGRDVTIGPERIPFWPDWLAPRDLLHNYAWAYIVGGVLLVLLVLPLTLALIEKIVLALRRKT